MENLDNYKELIILKGGISFYYLSNLNTEERLPCKYEDINKVLIEKQFNKNQIKDITYYLYADYNLYLNLEDRTFSVLDSIREHIDNVTYFEDKTESKFQYNGIKQLNNIITLTINNNNRIFK